MQKWVTYAEPRPFHGWFVRRLGLDMINLYTKHEVSTLTHYKYMKNDKNAKIGGGLWGLGILKGHRKHNHSIERIQLSIKL